MSIKSIVILVLSIMNITLIIVSISLFNKNKTVLFIPEDSDYKKAVQYYDKICKSLQKINNYDFITPMHENSTVTKEFLNKIKSAITTINTNFSQELLLKVLSIETAVQTLGKLQDNLPRRDIGIDILDDFLCDFNKIKQLLDEQNYRA
ncbi:MAG: hypothetical protein IJ848_01980 [Alphaproteobacteria bacterium]|nr:hypothetical protein [Alphaproteobacteria bacterium]